MQLIPKTARWCLTPIVVIATLTFSGCSSYFYTPTHQQVLNFKEKGDVAINGSIDGNDGSGVSAGYAITNHIAVNSDFKAFERHYGQTYKYNSYMWDNELILYAKQPAEKGHLVYAVNLGYGIGEIGRNSTYYGVNINRKFLQPSIGYTGRWFLCALSLRLSSVKYNVRPWYGWNPDNYRSLEETFEMPLDGSDYFFTEPAITLGFGYKAFWFRAQRSFASKGSGKNFSYIKDNLSLSLNVSFNTIRLFGRKGS